MNSCRLFVLCTLLLLSYAAVCSATEQKTFTTPGEAVKVLVAALEANNVDELYAIFGEDGKDLVSSGDPIQDKNGRQGFLKSYKAKHALVTQDEDPNKRVLQVGAKNWEMPIPIVKDGDKWRFDTAAGKQELIYRRIGDNELGAIATCRGYIAAQEEYAATGHDGLPAGLYAQKWRSDPGKQNGLYWEAKEGEPESPVGPLLAQTAEEGYGKDDPYHGYYYHSLKAQGPAAKGGAKSYIVVGQLKDGIALVAYPAQYKSSGVMTFIINQDGEVFQKDLGEKTTELAKAMTEYNPDGSWTKVKD
jgi:hypothetical protein